MGFKNSIKDTFRKESNFKYLLLAVLVTGLSYGLYKGMLDNYLAEVVAIIGSVLVFAMISLPHDMPNVFLVVFLIAYVGRVLVDYAIPVMLIRVVPADIAGIYNAGRNILLNLSSTVSVFAVGALLGKISALWLLSACALAYLIGMIWYIVLYKKYMK